jgi:hemerythrin superfamily protein
MDVYRILIQDHRAIEKMFDEIALTSGMEPDRRRQLFSSLAGNLEDHEIIEENEFFTSLIETSSFSSAPSKQTRIKELVAEMFDNHSDFAAISQQISNLSGNDDEWLERVNELRDLVREHMFNEEETLFPAAQEVLDRAQAQEIGRQIGERRQGPGNRRLEEKD